MAQASGLRSPPSSVSPAPRLKFDGDLLKAYIKKLLSTTLQNSPWFDVKDRDRVKAWIKEIGERVKERMLEIQPRGFKYVVLTQINENRGQGGRAGIACHWEDNDVVAQEVYYNHLPLLDRRTTNIPLELPEIPHCNRFSEHGMFMAALHDLVIFRPYHTNLLPQNEWPRLQGSSRRSGSFESCEVILSIDPKGIHIHAEKSFCDRT